MDIKQLFNIKNPKLYSILLTVIIIGMLIISGPATAVNLSIDDLPSSVVSGNPASFSVSVDIASGEALPIEEFEVLVTNLNTSANYSCRFYANGSIISCDSQFASLTAANNNVNQGQYSGRFGYGYGVLSGSTGYYNRTWEGYGYGFGYGYGATYLTNPELKYSLSFTPPSSSTQYVYEMEFFAKTDNNFKYKTTSSSQITATATSSGGGSGGSSGGGGYVPPEEESSGDETPSPEPTKTVEEKIEDAIDKAFESLGSGAAVDEIKNKIYEVFEEIKKAVTEVMTVTVLATKEDAKQGAAEQIEAVRKVAEQTGGFFDPEDIEFATVTETEEVNKLLKEEITEPVREEIKKKLEELGLSGKDLDYASGAMIRQKTKITTITTKDGKTKSVIETVMTVEIGDHVVEIPKEVAATTDYIIGDYEIIEKDPIILFKQTDTIKYSIVTDSENTEQVMKESERIAIAKVVDKENQEPVVAPETPDDSEPVVPESKGGIKWLPIMLVVLLIAAIIVGYFLTSNVSYYSSRAEKLHKEADHAHASGDLNSAQEKHAKANKYYKKSLEKR